ncbi:hypothetical protein J2X04_001375 [Lysobacter niabensis]|uniref:Permease n=1 Tax=Agrilutibacter niabensis TaxID=380628 RepID=A0ABU1VPK3_9GAMM|nr:hypothetical protein [Lysobacter niabensis]MDR7099028.1 hypothetical protein [Lysobacter niabensis]
MAKLALEQAPPTALPRRFLLTTPVWGVVAGALLLFDADIALLSRWAPATLALVHAFTLGVLGNAMFGSLLQFLPAAAGVRVRGGPAAGYGLHALLNLGVLALCAGFRLPQPHCLALAAACLATAFAGLAAMTLPGLLAATAQRLLRAGVGIAVLAGVATATLGVAMLLGLAGVGGGLPLWPWIDLHAATGLLGWCGVLVASVAQVVMPMFQGAAPSHSARQGVWLGAVVVVVLAGTFCALRGNPQVLRWGSGACAVAFAAPALWRQRRAKHTRNAWLVRAWRAGLLALLAAALVAVFDGPGLLVGTLVIALGLPLLLVGMQLEIVAFLGWIELHRRAGRGVRLPSVQQLLPDADKARVLVLQLGAGALLLVAVAWPHPALARLAGALLVGAYAALFLALRGVGRRGHRFLLSREAIA